MGVGLGLVLAFVAKSRRRRQGVGAWPRADGKAKTQASKKLREAQQADTCSGDHDVALVCTSNGSRDPSLAWLACWPGEWTVLLCGVSLGRKICLFLFLSRAIILSIELPNFCYLESS